MSNSIKTAQQWLRNANAILVTASNGFSITEGLNLFAHDDRFTTVLGSLAQHYKLPNLLGAVEYHYPDELDRWRAYARINEYYNYQYQPGELMAKLQQLLADKPAFIWTSNIDHHFALAGFDNYLEIEGNWQTGVCASHPADHPVVDLREKLHQIFIKDQEGTLTTADLPSCDNCGSPLALNLPEKTFKMNQQQVSRFESFITKYQDQQILVLELGIGPNNQLIKAPSMQLIAGNSKSHYITINKDQLNIPAQIADRAIGFSSTILEAFDALLTGKGQLTVQGPTKAQPKLSPAEEAQQEKMLQSFYPSYIINHGYRPGEMVMYTTVDQQHPSHLHMSQADHSLMYSYGDPVNVHCFTQDGQYRLIKLGLNKNNHEVHGCYINAGTFVAIEAATGPTGFSQLSITFPTNSANDIMVPRVRELTKLFPKQASLIKRLAINGEQD